MKNKRVGGSGGWDEMCWLEWCAGVCVTCRGEWADEWDEGGVDWAVAGGGPWWGWGCGERGCGVGQRNGATPASAVSSPHVHNDPQATALNLMA